MNASMPRLQFVELLRGLAALSVAWFHLTATQRGGWLAASGSYGWLGVEVFFVISGFIVPYSMQRLFRGYRLSDAPTFFARRIVRLEPAYIASIALVITLYYASRLAPGFSGGEQTHKVTQILSHLFYLIPLTEHQWLQPIYWTLAYEFAFYMFMGVSLATLCGMHQRLAVWVVVAIVGVLVLTELAPARIMLFVLGFSVFRQKEGLASVVESILLMIIAGGTMIIEGAFLEAICGALTAFLLLFASELQIRSPLARLVGMLGAISYSLYLVHIPVGGRVVNLGKRFAASPMEEFTISIIALGISLAAAWILWRLIEVPSIRLSRKLGQERAPDKPSVS